MATITDATLQQITQKIEQQNSILRGWIEEYMPTWMKVRENVRAGKAKEMYCIGDELIGTYTYNGTVYECPWVVLDNDRECEWADGTKHPGLWIGMKYSTIESIAFDSAEQEDATEQTAQEGIYYCGRNGSTYTMLNLSVGDSIPYANYEHIYHGIVNNVDVYKSGYNRWSHSAKRQWLNSASGKGEWWTAQHIGDTAPNQLSFYKGFMAGLDSDFLSVVTPVKVKTACNTVVDGGATDITVDRFFLQSEEEIYAVPQIENIEGPYFPYWKQITGLDNPTPYSYQTPNDGRKIKQLNNSSGNATMVHLRSCYTGSTHIIRAIFSGGFLYNYGANFDYTSLPACVIS